MRHSFHAYKILIQSFTLLPAPEGEDFQTLRLCRASSYGRPGEAPSPLQEINLSFKLREGAGMKSFQKKLASTLQELEHPVTPAILNILLALIAWRIDGGCTMESALDDLFDQCCTADVSHFTFLPVDAPDTWSENLLWQGFEIGKPDLKKLESRIQKAGHHWEEFSEAQGILPASRSRFKNNPGLASPIYRGNKVIDFLPFFDAQDSGPGNLLDQLLNRYWSAMQHIHSLAMWSDFDEKRLIPAALQYEFFDVRAFRRAANRAEISIYLNFSNKRPSGRVAIVYPGELIEMLDLRATRSALDEMERRHSMSKLSASSMTPVLLNACYNIRIGWDRLRDGRPSESHLHFIIALEQVFSEKTNTTRSVVNRTSALLHRQLSMSFPECRKLVTGLYDARSKYVHAGDPVHPHFFAGSLRIPEVLVYALLHVCNRPESSESTFHRTWLKKLDWVVAGFEAGIHPDTEVCDQLGIIEGPLAPLPGSGDPL